MFTRVCVFVCVWEEWRACVLVKLFPVCICLLVTHGGVSASGNRFPLALFVFAAAWHLSRQRWNMRPSLPAFHKHHNYVPERKSTALIGDKCARWLIWSTLPFSSLLDFMFFFFIASTKGGWMSRIFFSCYFYLFCVPVWRSGVLIGTAALVWWLHTTVCVPASSSGSVRTPSLPALLWVLAFCFVILSLSALTAGTLLFTYT